MLGLAVALLVAGPLSDRYGRTPLIHASLALSALVGLGCALAPSWTALLGLRTLEGVALAGLPAVATAYLREELHPATHARAVGLYVGGTALGGMTGRLLTGGVAEAAGWRWALAAAAGLGLVCAVVVLVLLPRSQHFEARTTGWRSVLTTTRLAVSDRGLLALFGIGGCSIGVLTVVFNTVGFRLALSPFHLGLAAASLLFCVYPLGSVSSAVSGRLADRYGRRAVLPARLPRRPARGRADPAGLAPPPRRRARPRDRRLLRHPRRREQLGAGAGPRRRAGHRPGRLALPLRLLRRRVGLRRPGRARLVQRGLAARRRCSPAASSSSSARSPSSCATPRASCPTPPERRRASLASSSMRSRHVSVVIHRPPGEVYAFAADPENLARWAAGLASAEVPPRGRRPRRGRRPLGPVRIAFVQRNAYGVLDHDVTTPDGTTTHNPLRVLAHPDGAEVVFSLRQLSMTDDELDRDAALVAGRPRAATRAPRGLTGRRATPWAGQRSTGGATTRPGSPRSRAGSPTRCGACGSAGGARSPGSAPAATPTWPGRPTCCATSTGRA